MSACVARPSTDLFQTPMAPNTIGMFCCNGADTKCSSMARMPSNIWSCTSGPKATTLHKLTAEETEYRPPTHCHIANE